MKQLTLVQEIKAVNEAIKSLNETIKVLELARYPGPAMALSDEVHKLLELNRLNEKKLSMSQN